MKGRHWQTVLSPVEGTPRLMTSPLPCFSTKWGEAERRWFRRNLTVIHNYLMGWCGVRGTRGTEHMENCNLIRRSTFNIRVVEQCRRSSEGLQDLHPWKYSKCDWSQGRALWSGWPCFKQHAGRGGLQRTLSSVQFCNKVYVVPMS